MTPAPTIDDVRRAAERIAGEAVRTPLLSSPALDAAVGGRVFLKCENLQRTGSFKFRGAHNAIAALTPEERSKGVVAVSSGNHAQGVAAVAGIFNIAATIVMPSDAPAVKRQRTEALGASVVTYDRAREDREAVAARYIAKNGGALIHPYNDANVIAGQGTIGLEIVAELAATKVVPDAIIVPCGGGGLSSGIGLAMCHAFPAIDVVLVEPTGFDDYGRSLREERIVANIATSGSLCDALLTPSPGAIGFAINRANRARGIAVDDSEALAAVAYAFSELKLVLEPGGAVALAAILGRCVDVAGRTVVLVLSGGNVDAGVLRRALA
jgi:threonine dehydratase